MPASDMANIGKRLFCPLWLPPSNELNMKYFIMASPPPPIISRGKRLFIGEGLDPPDMAFADANIARRCLASICCAALGDLTNKKQRQQNLKLNGYIQARSKASYVV